MLADHAGRFYSGRRSLRLSRGEEVIEVAEPTWAQAIGLLGKHGWNPSRVPDLIMFESDLIMFESDLMSQADAKGLARIGREILESALRNPLEFQIRFDMAKFAEIIEFASGGSFKIER